MNKQLKILIFTKDETLGSLLQECLTSEEFATETYANETEAYDRFRDVGFHLCIIDVSPNHKEVLLANAFKAITDDVKLIFLMDNPAKEDIIEVFGSGADDMMRKPISLEILQARINAIVKRTFEMQPQQSVIFRFGIFTFNTHTQSLFIGTDREQKLTTKESELLSILCHNANNLVDRMYTLQSIWKNDSYFNARSMDVYITKLRHILKEDPSIRIENVHGKGYKLVTKAAEKE